MGELVNGFTVTSFGSALMGAVIVSVTTLMLNGLVGPKQGKRKGVDKGGRGKRKRVEREGDDVIDV